METKNYVLTLAFLTAVVLMSACAQQPRATQAVQAAPFVGGSQGLVLSFLPGQPPAEIPEKTPFIIAVNAENKGEADIGAGEARFEIEGIAAKEFNYTANQVSPGVFKPMILVKYNSAENIAKAKKAQNQIVPGGSAFVTFEDLSREVMTGDYLVFPGVKVVTQYPYKTTTLGSVCLKQSVAQAITGGPEVCKLIQEVQPQNTGAPVQVTAISQLPSGVKLTVRNVGGGVSYYNGTGNSANTTINFNNKDRVNITSIKIGSGESFADKCSPQILFLINNEATAFCTKAFTGTAQDYTEVLEINLDYGYRQELPTTLKILNTD